MAPAGPEPGINKVVAGARGAGNGIGALRLVRWGARPRNRRTHRAAGTGGRLQQLTCTLDMAPVADKFSWRCCIVRSRVAATVDSGWSDRQGQLVEGGQDS